MSIESSVAWQASITQRDLEEYQALKRQRQDIDARLKLERSKLLQLVDDGVPVEPGPLRLRVSEFFRRRVTNSRLVALLGKDGFETILAHTPGALEQRVDVWDGGSGRGGLADRPGRWS